MKVGIVLFMMLAVGGLAGCGKSGDCLPEDCVKECGDDIATTACGCPSGLKSTFTCVTDGGPYLLSDGGYPRPQ